jgi:hypothetical protein
MWNDRSAARVSLVVIAVAWCAGAWVWTRTIAESPSATIAPAAMVVRDVAIDTLAERGDRDLLAGKTEEALAAYRELAALVPADGRACEPQPGIEEPAYCPAAPPTAAPPSSPR